MGACREAGTSVAYSSVRAAIYEWTDQGKTSWRKAGDHHLYADGFNRSRLLFENYMPLIGVLFSTKEVSAEGLFDESLDINEDWDLLIRMSRGREFAHVPEVGAEYRMFPKEEADAYGAALGREDIHASWFRRVFDKHRHLITGEDWDAFYRHFLIPRHEGEIRKLNEGIISLEFLMGEKAKEISLKEHEIRLKDGEIETLKDEIQARLREIVFLNECVEHERAEMASILASESWRLTAPLRALGRAARTAAKAVRYVFSNRPTKVFKRAVLSVYHSRLVEGWLRYVPIPFKQRIKRWLLVGDEPMRVEPLGETPKVSIIVPVYNHAKYLKRCIGSALGQEYPRLEVVVVDDASPDPEVGRILAGFEGEPGIRLLRNDRNMGISGSQNRAIIESSGDIIAFLDCDDYLTPDAVSKSIANWDRSTVYLHTGRINVDGEGREMRRISFEHLPRKDYFAENLERMFATHFKLIRRDAFARVGLFDTRFDSAQDYDMLMRVSFHYPSSAFKFVPFFAYHHRLHGGQASVTKEERQSSHTETIQREGRLRKGISEGRYDSFLSVIMLSFGKDEQTVEAVESIERTVKIPHEIILFDNGSDEATVRRLKSHMDGAHPTVRLFLNPENLGPAEGRRRALEHAKGPYYLIFDNDEIAEPGWIEEMLVRAGLSDEIGAVCSRVCFPDNKLQFSGGYVKDIDGELIELSLYDKGSSRYDLSAAVFRECDWLPIGATLFKTNPSPHLHGGYRNLYEDAGVSFALKSRGMRLVNSPGSMVLHNHFLYRDSISMKGRYLKERYDPEGMLRAVASFYAENGKIIYDEYVWKENGLNRLSREALRQLLSSKAGPARRSV